MVHSGFEGTIFFLIQMQGALEFQPNAAMDPRFSEALRFAQEHGVRVGN